MRILVACIACILLSACETPPDGSLISRIGLLSNLSEKAKKTYLDDTIFGNEFDEAAIDWSFPKLVIREFEEQITAGGRKAVDLSDLPAMAAQQGDLFELGYSLSFGLSDTQLASDTAALLDKTMTDKKLDAIIVLHPAGMNTDTEFGEPYPQGGFGVFRRGGTLVRDRAYTYVQYEARIVTGRPPELGFIAYGTNLREQPLAGDATDFNHPAFRKAMEEQVAESVKQVLTQMRM